MMRCGFCGYEFEEAEGLKGCKNCPMNSGCKMVKCPKCNYENPPEAGLVKGIKNLFSKDKK
jgi:rubredoxin